MILIAALLLISVCNPCSLCLFSDVNPRIIHVKEDFATIQEAINGAHVGDVIYVSSGTYYEHVVVNKTVSLVGENSSTTIIDGGNSGTVVQITADGVSISGFKLQNSGWGWYRSGIETQHADNCRIENNTLFHTCHNIRLNNSRDCLVSGNVIDHITPMGYGIRLTESVNCTVANNFVANNIGGIVFENSSGCTALNNYVTRNSDGIRLYSSCVGNRIAANTVFNNSYCGMIYPVPGNEPPLNNTIIHNNFINNTNPFIVQSGGNIWDDGYEGNYWTSYASADLNQDGIGDAPYDVGMDRDNYPLMGRFYEFEAQSNGKAYAVHIVCNSNVTGFNFEPASNGSKIDFNLTGETAAFCRITVSTDLMNYPFTALVDNNVGSNVTLKTLQKAPDRSILLYFTYPAGQHRMKLVSGSLPTSSSQVFVQALLIASVVVTGLVLIGLGKRKKWWKPKPNNVVHSRYRTFYRQALND